MPESCETNREGSQGQTQADRHLYAAVPVVAMRGGRVGQRWGSRVEVPCFPRLLPSWEPQRRSLSILRKRDRVREGGREGMTRACGFHGRAAALTGR